MQQRSFEEISKDIDRLLQEDYQESESGEEMA